MYAGNERDRGVNSAHQQQPHPDDHSSLNKRPCLVTTHNMYVACKLSYIFST